MMRAVVVDSDVASYFLKGDTRRHSFQPHLVGRDRVLSFMTVAEIRLGARVRRWGPRRVAAMEAFFAGSSVQYADDHLCTAWASLREQAHAHGRVLKVADGWVAATALLLSVPLVTNNVKDFGYLSGLTILGPVP